MAEAVTISKLRRKLMRGAAVVATMLLAGSCANPGPTSPTRLAAPLFDVTASATPVRISEFHYDNAGTDAGEAIEISGPVGTDLTGWQLVLYNGNGGAAYNTRVLSGVLAATCATRGVQVLTYPVDGIQNGSPDGIALVDAGGAVVEFLSYEGVFTAVGGPRRQESTEHRDEQRVHQVAVCGASSFNARIAHFLRSARASAAAPPARRYRWRGGRPPGAGGSHRVSSHPESARRISTG